jgi:hypothetical protein
VLPSLRRATAYSLNKCHLKAVHAVCIGGNFDPTTMSSLMGNNKVIIPGAMAPAASMGGMSVPMRHWASQPGIRITAMFASDDTLPP